LQAPPFFAKPSLGCGKRYGDGANEMTIYLAQYKKETKIKGLKNKAGQKYFQKKIESI